MISLNNGWEFTENWSEEFARGKGEGEPVRIPHTVRELPYHYADHHDYEMISGYRRVINISRDLTDKRVFVYFEAAGHIATVYLDGEELATHRTGYTAFEVELTGRIVTGKDHLLAVKLDSTENGEVPPFGFVIDYLTYGGIYRPVWLKMMFILLRLKPISFP